jgi:hypothetical protein
MAGHSIKISPETYAHVVLAASEARQTVSQWMEDAARTALAHQDHAVKLSRYREAQIRAAERREGAPLARDYGLSPSRL